MAPTEGIGIVAGFLTTISAIPQIVRVLRRGSAGDLSLATLVLFTVGVALWLVYGIAAHSVAVTLWNAITLALYLALTGIRIATR